MISFLQVLEVLRLIRMESKYMKIDKYCQDNSNHLSEPGGELNTPLEIKLHYHEQKGNHIPSNNKTLK